MCPLVHVYVLWCYGLIPSGTQRKLWSNPPLRLPQVFEAIVCMSLQKAGGVALCDVVDLDTGSEAWKLQMEAILGPWGAEGPSAQ